MHDQTDYTSMLQSPDRITAEDVRLMRRDVWHDGIVSQLEAEAVFDLNDRVIETCPEWRAFFIEAMTEFTVNQAEPRGYISNANAKWLVDRISHDGVVDTASELELLVRVLAKAKEAPPALAGFALAQVAHAIVHAEGPLANGMRINKGIVGEAEVDLLRTILYAAAGANGLSISRTEAEILFDINENTDASQNHSSWQDLFVRATGNYLMAVSMPTAPSRTEALARAEWLEDQDADVPGFMGRMFSGLGDLFTADFFDEVFMSSHVQIERRWKQRNDAFESEIKANEAVTAGEADWLIERINRDGAIHENEKALLTFIGRESSQVDPRVRELIDKYAA